MSDASKNPWPKVISHRYNIGGVKYQSKEPLLWPCHAFEVAIPINEQGLLNIFELTIVKLSMVFSSNAVMLADATCLDVQVVQFIQNRLYHLEMLDKRFQPTEKAKELVAQTEDKQPKYHSANVFVELLGGHVLPIVDIKPLSFERVIGPTQDGDLLEYEQGSYGKKKVTCARMLAPQNDALSKQLQSEEVVRVIRAFSALNHRFSLLSGRYQGLPEFSCDAAAISIMPEPTMVYLGCNIIMQYGSHELLLTEPFGYGFSHIFKRQIDVLNDTWLTEVKRKAMKQKFRSGERKTDNLPTGFNSQVEQYQQITRNLKDAEAACNQILENKGHSTNQKTTSTDLVGRAVKALYQVIEWTFKQLVFDNPAVHWQKVFISQNESDNRALIVNLATKYGFKSLTAIESRIQVTKAKINAMNNGNAEIQSLLAMTIAGASEDSRHPLHNLVIDDPDCLKFIFELKRLRDAESHGELLNLSKQLKRVSGGEGSVTALESFKRRVWCLVWSLYPALKETGPLRSCDRVKRGEDFEALLLRAEVELESCFGKNEVKLLPKRLYEQLRKAQMQLLSEATAPNAFITPLAAALEVATHYATKTAVHNKVLGKEAKSRVEVKLQKHGLLRDRQTLPNSLSKVANKNITKAATGLSASLGANVLVFLDRVADDDLARLAKESPGVVSLIDQLLCLRGHSNEADEQPLCGAHAQSLINNTYQLVKYLQDVSNG